MTVKKFTEILGESKEDMVKAAALERENDSDDEIKDFIKKTYTNYSGSLAKSMVKVKYGMVRNKDFKVVFAKEKDEHGRKIVKDVILK